MKIVNPYFLLDLMSPVAGLGDDDEAVKFYMKLGKMTEIQYRNIIKGKIVDYFNSLDGEKKQNTKLALSFYLSKADTNFERPFNSCLPPFDEPENPRDFFVWLWEEFFPGESYLINDFSGYEIVPNIHEPNRPPKKIKE